MPQERRWSAHLEPFELATTPPAAVEAAPSGKSVMTEQASSPAVRAAPDAVLLAPSTASARHASRKNEGASGSGLLAIDVDVDVLPNYELVQERAPHREWCVPAALLNRYPVRSISEEEEDALEDEAWLRRMGRRMEGPGS